MRIGDLLRVYATYSYWASSPTNEYSSLGFTLFFIDDTHEIDAASERAATSNTHDKKRELACGYDIFILDKTS